MIDHNLVTLKLEMVRFLMAKEEVPFFLRAFPEDAELNESSEKRPIIFALLQVNPAFSIFIKESVTTPPVI